MYNAIVNSVDILNRKADITTKDGQNKRVTIPINLSEVSVGCEVVVDKDNSTIVAIIDYPKYDQEILYSSTSSPSACKFKPTNNQAVGDYVRAFPQTGFLSLLRGYVASFGGSPLSQIIAFGKQKILRFIADNFEILGKNININILENESGLPILNFNVGNLTIYSDCNSELSIELKNIVKIIFSERGSSISIYNKDSDRLEEVYTNIIEDVEQSKKQKLVLNEINAKLISLSLQIKDSLDLISNSIVNIGGTEINITSSGNTTVKGKNITLDSNDELLVKSPSGVYINVGNVSPGSFNIINGTVSKFSMDPAGITKIKSPQIQINGMEDQLVSNIQLSTLLINMMNSLEPTSTAIKTISIQLKTLSSLVKAVPPLAPASAVIDNVIINLDMISSGIDTMRTLCISSVTPPGMNLIGNKFISTGLIYTPGP